MCNIASPFRELNREGARKECGCKVRDADDQGHWRSSEAKSLEKRQEIRQRGAK